MELQTLVHAASDQYEYLLDSDKVLAEGVNLDTQDVLTALGIDFQSQYSQDGKFDFGDYNGIKYEVTDNSETIRDGNSILATGQVLQVSDICLAFGKPCMSVDNDAFVKHDPDMVVKEPFASAIIAANVVFEDEDDDEDWPL